MIPDLSSPYLSNGPLSPGGARTVSVRPAVPGPVGAGLGGMRPQARPWCGGWGLLRRSWAELVCGVKLPCGGLVRDCVGQCRDESKDLFTFRLWEILAFGRSRPGGFCSQPPKFLFLPKENLDLCLLLRVGVVVSFSFLETSQLSPWQGGQLGKSLEEPSLRCPLTSGLSGLL